ncbi:hypothetical protein AMTR_s00063p00107170 [Amborella trichopoda]|uniref:Uncharacterized protein n=1 Tax=Amborella trichopoda TaxID=13333 RepID=U5D1C8_AMBTC|nr:hypothetical protein AMTR_s00063p00107170 [Amborella trichopoda]
MHVRMEESNRRCHRHCWGTEGKLEREERKGKRKDNALRRRMGEERSSFHDLETVLNLRIDSTGRKVRIFIIKSFGRSLEREPMSQSSLKPSLNPPKRTSVYVSAILRWTK